MNPVTHFEMPYDDPGRLSAFYKAAFGWKMKNLGEKMGHYVLAGTTENSADGTPKVPGRINGGFFARKSDWPDQYPSVVIAVDDIKKSMAKVASAGGSVLGEPMDIPGIGAYVSFKDSEGNRVGMLEPLPMMKEKKKAVAKKKGAARKKPKAGPRRKSRAR
jgi:predicted enzyme related to lactoylglutathione lyase